MKLYDRWQLFGEEYQRYAAQSSRPFRQCVDFPYRSFMGFTMDWDNAEHTMIQVAITGMWTWQEYDAALNELYAMLDTINHAVAVLVYPADGVRIQLPSDAPIRLWQSLQARWKGRHYLVLVRSLHRGNVLYNLFSRLLPSMRGHVLFANTLEEARRVAAEKLAAHENH